jgi:hypothetical protein
MSNNLVDLIALHLFMDKFKMVHNVDTTIIDADSDHSDTTDVITNKDPV